MYVCAYVHKSVDCLCTSVSMLSTCPCVHVRVGSTLLTAVEISVAVGALSSSRCGQYHVSVMLHFHTAQKQSMKQEAGSSEGKDRTEEEKSHEERSLNLLKKDKWNA